MYRIKNYSDGRRRSPFSQRSVSRYLNIGGDNTCFLYMELYRAAITHPSWFYFQTHNSTK